MAMEVAMVLDIPPVAVEVVEAVAASRADIHQRLHPVRRRLLHLAILQQRLPPSTHCRLISSLLTTDVTGQFMAVPRFPVNLSAPSDTTEITDTLRRRRLLRLNRLRHRATLLPSSRPVLLLRADLTSNQTIRWRRKPPS